MWNRPLCTARESSISTAPANENAVNRSLKNIQLSSDATRGPSAQKELVVSDESLLWATGCRVKPKHVQTTARIKIMIYWEGDFGIVKLPSIATLIHDNSPVVVT